MRASRPAALLCLVVLMSLCVVRAQAACSDLLPTATPGVCSLTTALHMTDDCIAALSGCMTITGSSAGVMHFDVPVSNPIIIFPPELTTMNAGNAGIIVTPEFNATYLDFNNLSAYSAQTCIVPGPTLEEFHFDKKVDLPWPIYVVGTTSGPASGLKVASFLSLVGTDADNSELHFTDLPHFEQLLLPKLRILDEFYITNYGPNFTSVTFDSLEVLDELVITTAGRYNLSLYMPSFKAATAPMQLPYVPIIRLPSAVVINSLYMTQAQMDMAQITPTACIQVVPQGAFTFKRMHFDDYPWARGITYNAGNARLGAVNGSMPQMMIMSLSNMVVDELSFPNVIYAYQITFNNVRLAQPAILYFPVLYRANTIQFISLYNMTTLIMPSWSLNHPLMWAATYNSRGNPAMALTVSSNPNLVRTCLNSVPTNVALIFQTNPLLNPADMRGEWFNASLGYTITNVCATVAQCNGTTPNPRAGCPAPVITPPPPGPPPPPPMASTTGHSGTGTTSGTSGPSGTTGATSTGSVGGATKASRDCPEGAICPGGGVIIPKPGYWNSGTDSGFVAVCEEPAELRCQGGTNSTCGEGYTGPLCGTCAPGSYPRGTECITCPEGDGSQAALYTVNGIILVLFGVGHVALNDVKLDYLVTAFKWLQMLRVAGTKTGYNLPIGLKEIYSNLALVTFDYEFLRPACSDTDVQVDFHRIFWGNAVVIAVAVAPPLIIIGILAAADARRRGFWVNRLIRTAIIYASLMYFVIVTRAVQATTCVSLGDVRVLKAYTNTPCNTADVTSVAAIGIIFFVIGTPVGIAIMVMWLHHKSLLEDDKFKSRFGYMYHKLRTDNHYRFMYDSVKLVHLLLVAIAWNAFPNTSAPYGFVLFTYLALFVGVIIWRPFISPRKNGITVLSVGIGLVSAIASVAALTAQDTPSASLPLFIVFFIIIFGIAFFVFVWERHQERQRAQTAAAAKKLKLSGSSSGHSGDEVTKDEPVTKRERAEVCCRGCLRDGRGACGDVRDDIRACPANTRACPAKTRACCRDITSKKKKGKKEKDQSKVTVSGTRSGSGAPSLSSISATASRSTSSKSVSKSASGSSSNSHSHA